MTTKAKTEFREYLAALAVKPVAVVKVAGPTLRERIKRAMDDDLTCRLDRMNFAERWGWY